MPGICVCATTVSGVTASPTLATTSPLRRRRRGLRMVAAAETLRPGGAGGAHAFLGRRPSPGDAAKGMDNAGHRLTVDPNRGTIFDTKSSIADWLTEEHSSRRANTSI